MLASMVTPRFFPILHNKEALMRKSKDIMTSNVVTINAKDTMANAYSLMHEKYIRHLPVVDDRNKIVGMLSDRDVHLTMSVKKTNILQQTISLNKELLVEDFMNWPVFMVSEETSLKKVAEEMLAQKVSAFIVQDSVGHLKGIITTDDLIKLFLVDSPVRPETTIKSLTRHFFNSGIA